jgi:hypothetical protein
LPIDSRLRNWLLRERTPCYLDRVRNNIIYPDGAHGFTLFPNALAEQASARMDAFLRRVST